MSYPTIHNGRYKNKRNHGHIPHVRGVIKTPFKYL